MDGKETKEGKQSGLLLVKTTTTTKSVSLNIPALVFTVYVHFLLL